MGHRSQKGKPAHLIKQARKKVAVRFAEARAAFGNGEKELARRRVKQARKAAMAVRLRIPTYWNRYCRHCNAYLVQGENSTIRLRSGMRLLRCQECGYVRRKVTRS